MDRQLRVTDNVCEQHMRDLELNFLFNLGGHMDSHGIARRKDTLTYTADGREQTRPWRNRYRPREEPLFGFFAHNCIRLKPSPLSVPILAQPHISIEAS